MHTHRRHHLDGLATKHEATENTMNDLTKHLADAHMSDLRRDAERLGRAASLRAYGQRQPVRTLPITIRRATPDDEIALTRLAALDSARAPARPLLIAERDGELRAALSLRDGDAVADPFYPSQTVLELLAAAAAEEVARPRAVRRRWRLRGIRRRALQHREHPPAPVAA